MLEARARLAGCSVNTVGVARDNVDDLRSRIQQGLNSDVLILSGGVSAGVRDLVPPTLDELGVKCVFHKVQLKPGKPIWFGVHEAENRRTLVFGLPGNPVSSLVCFELFVQAAIRCIFGRTSEVDWQPIRLAEEFKTRGNRPTFWPAKWYRDEGRLFAQPLPLARLLRYAHGHPCRLHDLLQRRRSKVLNRREASGDPNLIVR